MKKIFTPIIALVALCLSVNAQVDEISVGAGYSYQAFYSLSTGNTETLPHDSWDIAFSAIGRADGGVFINEGASYGQKPIKVFLAQTANWSEAITDTLPFADSLALTNTEENWTQGAFNTVRDTSSQFDYGWGAYNPETHTLEGNRIFVLKKRNGSYIKFQVEKLSRGTYHFKYANLDGKNEKIASVSKDDNPGGLVYFSFTTNEKVAIPKHDLVFQRYKTRVKTRDGRFLPYTVTGVLLAPGVSAAVADGVDPEKVKESDYADAYSSLPTTIGYNWKSFSLSNGWSIVTDRTHFVKRANGDIYQLTFLDFEGSRTGGITLKRKLIMATVPTVDFENKNLAIRLTPNPTSDYFKVVSDVSEDVTVTIFSSTGQKVRTYDTMTNSNMPIADLSSGLYFVTILSDTVQKTERLIIK